MKMVWKECKGWIWRKVIRDYYCAQFCIDRDNRINSIILSNAAVCSFALTYPGGEVTLLSKKVGLKCLLESFYLTICFGIMYFPSMWLIFLLTGCTYCNCFNIAGINMEFATSSVSNSSSLPSLVIESSSVDIS